jgi:SHS2 domain-containing protein
LICIIAGSGNGSHLRAGTKREPDTMSGRWEHFPHGADIGIRGIGDTPAEAFAQAARAITAAVVDPAIVASAESVAFHCTGADLEDLLYVWLNALIWEMSVRRLLFGRFDVRIDGTTLDAVAYGEAVSPGAHQPAVEVKGATYTALSVRRTGDDWIAQCVIDV